jgi:hypothetical protein
MDNELSKGRSEMAGQKDIWDFDLSEIKLNKDKTRKHAERYRMGSVRMALGLIRTRDDFEKIKK